MDELENLKNNHSRMLYLIGQMYKDGEISNDIKINLKYLVFLNDDNLLGILRKGYTNIDDLKNEIKILGKNLDQEELEELFKDQNLFQLNNGHAEDSKKEENDYDVGVMSSPISSMLQNAKKMKQRRDKPVDDFKLDPSNSNGNQQDPSNSTFGP